MFRSTTKHDVRSQGELCHSAIASLRKSSAVLCDDVHQTTYGLTLPAASIKLLNNVVLGLTGNVSTACDVRRTVHTVSRYLLNGNTMVRMAFIQPEVVTSTAHLPLGMYDDLSRAQTELCNLPNTPSPGRLRKTAAITEVSGRLAPYVVDMSGHDKSATWSYCNVTRSRFLVIVTRVGCQEVLSLTHRSLKMMSGFENRTTSFKYDENLHHFCVNVSPAGEGGALGLGNNTSLILYNDGSFRANGKPGATYDVCKSFHDIAEAVFTSPLSSAFMESLGPT